RRIYCVVVLPRLPPPGSALFPYTTLFRSLHKVSERLATPRRRDDKDAHDIYRLLVAVSTGDLAATFRTLLLDDLSCDVTVQALRSEEHTSELQSRENLVCRLLLEKKKPQQ